jgi:hypothetical protein
MEAMRLSMLDEEERERKARAEREQQTQEEQRLLGDLASASTRNAAAATEAGGPSSPRPSLTSSEERQKRRLSGAFRDFFSHTSHGAASPSGSTTPSAPPTMARRDAPLPSLNPDDSAEPSLSLPRPLIPQSISQTTSETGSYATLWNQAVGGSSSPLRSSPLSNPPTFPSSLELDEEDSATTRSRLTPATEPRSYIGLPSEDDLNSTAEPSGPTRSDVDDKGKGRQHECDKDSNDIDGDGGRRRSVSS